MVWGKSDPIKSSAEYSRVPRQRGKILTFFLWGIPHCFGHLLYGFPRNWHEYVNLCESFHSEILKIFCYGVVFPQNWFWNSISAASVNFSSGFSKPKTIRHRKSLPDKGTSLASSRIASIRLSKNILRCNYIGHYNKSIKDEILRKDWKGASVTSVFNKKAQLSLTQTNPRDACEKFARFT